MGCLIVLISFFMLASSDYVTKGLGLLVLIIGAAAALREDGRL